MAPKTNSDVATKRWWEEYHRCRGVLVKQLRNRAILLSVKNSSTFRSLGPLAASVRSHSLSCSFCVRSTQSALSLHKLARSDIVTLSVNGA